jgi:hypothetical protein
MAPTKLAIHIPPDANPTNISQVIRLLGKSPDQTYGKASELTSLFEEQGIGSRGEIQSTAMGMQLLEKTGTGISISPIGIALSNVREDVLGDLLHFLMFSRWAEATPTVFLQSWTYRQICIKYWTLGRVDLTEAFLDALIGEILENTPQVFADLSSVDDGVSFGRKSLSGAHNWLRGIQPPVLEKSGKGDVFNRRSFCPPELLLMGLQWVLRDEQDIVGIDILLTREKREAICQVCLLEPDALDRALDWMLPIFPNVISPGTSAGFYGRFVRFHKVPTFEDIVR